MESQQTGQSKVSQATMKVMDDVTVKSASRYVPE
jgi:hypothetical protein